MSEFESAKQDFLEVLSIEPNNKAAKDQLNIVKAKIKQLHEKDKQIYGKYRQLLIHFQILFLLCPWVASIS